MHPKPRAETVKKLLTEPNVLLFPVVSLLFMKSIFEFASSAFVRTEGISIAAPRTAPDFKKLRRLERFILLPLFLFMFKVCLVIPQKIITECYNRHLLRVYDPLQGLQHR